MNEFLRWCIIRLVVCVAVIGCGRAICLDRGDYSSCYGIRVAFVLSCASVLGVVVHFLVTFADLITAWRKKRHAAARGENGVDDVEVVQAAAPFSAAPQQLCVGGLWRRVYPTHWGITLAQVRAFLEECRKDAKWKSSMDMYTFVDEFVKPRIRGTGQGLALLTNAACPLEVTVMISHAWQESVEEFFEALERTVADDDVMFICAFSLYQCEDGAGPSINEQIGNDASDSPFRQVLEHIKSRGQPAGLSWKLSWFLRAIPIFCAISAATLLYMPLMVHGCLPRMNQGILQCAYSQQLQTWSGPPGDGDIESTRIAMGAFKNAWYSVNTDDKLELADVRISLVGGLLSATCTLFSWVLTKSASQYTGRMVVVPNRNGDLYARLWCVYEIFVASSLSIPVLLARTLASAGSCKSLDALCKSEADTERIRGEIVAYGGGTLKAYGKVDQAIARATNSSRDRMWMPILVNMWPTMLMHLAFLRIIAVVSFRNEATWFLGAVAAFIIGSCVVFSLVYATARRYEGLPSTSALCVPLGIVLASGVALSAALVATQKHFWYLLVFTTALLVNGVALSVVLIFARVFPNPGPRVAHSLGIVAGRVLPALHMLVVPAILFLSWAGVSKLMTFGFYFILILDLVSVPVIWASVANNWGVRLSDSGGKT